MIWIAIVGSALATYAARALPFAVTLRRRVPLAASGYLEALPVAIIAALVGPAVVAPAGSLTRGPEPLVQRLVDERVGEAKLSDLLGRQTKRTRPCPRRRHSRAGVLN